MTDSDPKLQQQVQRLYQLQVYGRWLFVGVCWLSLAPFGVWGLRQEIGLWQEYFTWTAVRYGLAYHFLPAFCLFFCLGVTAAVLVWQSKHWLWGISPREKWRLEQQIRKIQTSGSRHPLWKWVIAPLHH
jgi:hypothetical protein